MPIVCQSLDRSYDTRAQVTGETDMEGSSIVYSYSIPAYNKSNPSGSGYDAAGNVVSVTDLVMGTWDYTYDHLNRIASANAIAGSYSSLVMNWTIDAFGDRTAQTLSGSPSAPVPQSWSATMSSGNNNRIAITQPSGATWTYDASGDVTFDGVNYYLYDGEGRLCAVKNSYTPFAMTGYLYDGNGSRIAKGTLTSFSCNLASNGFALTSSYVVGQGGEQLTELQGGTPVHTNVFADGGLLATYASSQTFFSFKDWLGTKRVEIGVTCKSTYESLPYGDELNPNGNCPDATEHHYTGKEHDTESGNDDFGARYYASVTGRFLTPDSPGDQQNENPQSMNLYAYVRNRVFTHTDPSGHFDCDQSTATCKSAIVAALQIRIAAFDIDNPNMFALQKVSDSIGTFGDNNGVEITSADLGAPGVNGSFTAAETTLNGEGANGAGSTITFNSNSGVQMSADQFAITLAHEGTHVEQNWAAGAFQSTSGIEALMYRWLDRGKPSRSDFVKSETQAYNNQGYMEEYLKTKHGQIYDPSLSGDAAKRHWQEQVVRWANIDANTECADQGGCTH